MAKLTEQERNRRSFLKYLAASPVVGMSAKSAFAATGGEMLERPQDPYQWWPRDPNVLIEKPDDALDVFDFEPVAHKNVPPAHFGFITSGADDDGGQRADRQDIAKFALRSRRLRDVRTVDTSREIFGNKYSMPFFLCPVGQETSAHPDGVLGGMRASGRHNVAQILSTLGNASIGECNKARNGTPAFFQLYNLGNWEVVKSIVQRAEREGAPMMALTVDGPSSRKQTQAERAKIQDRRICATCHEIRDPKRPKAQSSTIIGKGVFSEVPAELWQIKAAPEPMTWELMKRLRDITKMELFVKGIMHPDDAAMCVKLGYGVYISNHGGRNEDTSASTISVLPDVVATVKGKVPIFIDGGFRRGMDIVKALAMGATMVGFGRPWMWGLGAFGEAGVDKVIDIVKKETIAAMQQVGAASLKELNSSIVTKSL